MSNFFEKAGENLLYVFSFLAIIAAMFVVAYFAEFAARKRSGVKEKIFTVRTVAVIGVFSALSFILFLLEFPVPFAPAFYKLDFSEIPVLIGGFAVGPAAGVMIEFIKITLKLLIKGTNTAFIGDLANFVVGCAFILPATIIYRFRRTRKTAFVSCAVGTAAITLFGTFFNAIYLLPAFSKFYGMPLETIIAMGTEINAGIEGVYSFVFLAVAPLNLIKGLAVSVVTLLLYKPLMKALRRIGWMPKARPSK